MFGVVKREHQCSPVSVRQKSMAAATADLSATGPKQGLQYAAGRELGQPRHGLRCDHDLDGDERLLGRLSALITQRIDVELERGPGSRDSLPPCASIHVAARDFRD